jgi:type 1 glutamine amidotransferase
MNIGYFNFILPFCLLSGIAGNTELGSDPLRLLLITGGTPVKYHKIMIPTSLYSALSGNKNIIWDHASLDKAAFENYLRDLYDVLIIFNRSDSLSDQAKNNLQDFVESGKGIIVLHSGLSSYNDWDWWWNDVVGGKYQYNDNGNTPKSGYKKPEFLSLISDTDHPVTDAVGNFQIKDELYNKLVYSPKIKALYRTDHPESDGPLVWIGPHKRSRVISIMPGHFASTYFDNGFRSLLYNSIYWAGKKESLIKSYNTEGTKIMQVEFDAIKNIIEKAYIEGIHTTQNEATVRSGFHPDFEMLVLKDDKMHKVTLEEWFERIEQLKKENKEMWEKETRYDELVINFDGNSASAKFTVFKGEDYFSTDFMLLYKFKEVNKSALCL